MNGTVTITAAQYVELRTAQLLIERLDRAEQERARRPDCRWVRIAWESALAAVINHSKPTQVPA